MTKIVVTGGAGFIGCNLVRALCERGFDVHIVDRDASFRRGTLDSRARLHECDVRDLRFADIVTGAKTVFHFAASSEVQRSIDFPVESTENNLGGMAAVLDAALKNSVQRVVFASSSSIYGEQDVEQFTEDTPAKPSSPYALQKLLGESMMQYWCERGLEAVSLRFFNVYGPGFDPNGPYARVVGLFLDRKKKGLPLLITGDGTQTRDFVHMDDVVDATIRAGESQKIGKAEVINIGSGQRTSVLDIARAIGGPSEFIPAREEPHDTCASVAKAKELLDWTPKIMISDGIARLKLAEGVA